MATVLRTGLPGSGVELCAAVVGCAHRDLARPARGFARWCGPWWTSGTYWRLSVTPTRTLPRTHRRPHKSHPLPAILHPPQPAPPFLCCLLLLCFWPASPLLSRLRLFSLKSALDTGCGETQALHPIRPSSAPSLRLYPCPSDSVLSDTPGLAARSLPACRRTFNTRYRCSAAVSGRISPAYSLSSHPSPVLALLSPFGFCDLPLISLICNPIFQDFIVSVR
jgi:hypothetical protein